MSRTVQPIPSDPLGRRLALVLVVAAGVVLVTGSQYYLAQETAYRQAVSDQLQTVVDLKVREIARWRNDLLEDASWFIDGSVVPGRARTFFRDPANERAASYLREGLGSWRAKHHYSRILLLDSALDTRMVSPGPGGALDPLVRRLAEEAMRTNRIVVSDLYPGAVAEEVRMSLLLPLPAVEAGGAPGGVLVFEIDPQVHLFPTLQTWPTASATAETLLVRREGEEVVFLNALRHRADTALRLRHPLSDRNLPAARAARGERGVVTGVDYRGVRVMAALATVPDSPWAIVAKIDQAEVDAPRLVQSRGTGLAALLMVVSVGLGLALLWKRREAVFVRHELAELGKVEARLRASEERFRSLYESMVEMVVLHELVTDAAGRAVDYRILDCNPAFSAITGIAREKAVGSLASELFGSGVAPFLETYACTAQTGQSARFETAFAPMQKHFEVRVFSPGRGQFATVTSDITARTEAERSREVMLRELARKNGELEELMFVASHDLRGPLVNIQGFARRVGTDLAAISALTSSGAAAAAAPGRHLAEILGTRLPQALQFIEAGILKMDALISGLLQVSRLGRVPMKRQPLAMDALLQSVLGAHAYQLQQAAAAVRVEPLPSCAGDADLVNQVFSNLLDNAVKYRDLQRPLCVQVTGVAGALEAVYCVADTGQGIPAAQQPKIWEMFHRLHPEQSVAGHGLGLTIVRRIVDRLGGRVWVESEPGTGSRFFVALPLK